MRNHTDISTMLEEETTILHTNNNHIKKKPDKAKQ